MAHSVDEIPIAAPISVASLPSMHYGDPEACFITA